VGLAFDSLGRDVDTDMSRTSGKRHAGRTAVCLAARARRWREAVGQTTTEWLMIAGGLTAIGIFLNGIMPRTIRQFCRALVWSIRVIAP
jgi:hypothetical protein